MKLSDLKSRLSSSTSIERRQVLILLMNQKKEEEVHCLGCSGPCCTFRANSMQITPLETLDLYLFLINEKRWNENLKKSLSQCIEDYRLDYDLDTGSGQNFRRTYTCPFFTSGPKGCSISPAHKPYGCLGFNPQAKNISDGENCLSDQASLEERDKKYQGIESKDNSEIKKKLNLSWEKKPIPNALLEIAEKIIFD